LDVLSGIDELKIGVSYSLDGKPLPLGSMPADLALLDNVVVNYETLPGWYTQHTPSYHSFFSQQH
jgi:adenylosuccinate synthase